MRVYVECEIRLAWWPSQSTYSSKMLDVLGTVSQDTAQFPTDYKISESYQACIYQIKLIWQPGSRPGERLSGEEDNVVCG